MDWATSRHQKWGALPKQCAVSYISVNSSRDTSSDIERASNRCKQAYRCGRPSRSHRTRGIHEFAQLHSFQCSQKSPKTVRNICVTLQSMWRSARAWGYVAHDLMDGVVLPVQKRVHRFFFSAEEVTAIIGAAPEPHRTFYGLAAETGLRAGELCGIILDDLDLERRILFLR